MAPIESPVAPPAFGSFGRNSGPRLRAAGLTRLHRFGNGCQTWTPGMFARCGDGSCNCCPYGYHIDLDFVRFCETLKDTAGYQSYLEHLQALKRGKREQRKALEEVIACPQLLFQSRSSFPRGEDHSVATNVSRMQGTAEQQHVFVHSHDLRELTQQQEQQQSPPQQQQHFGKKIRPPIPFWWLCDVAGPTIGPNNADDSDADHDSLNDVIQDFEDTLHSSHGDQRTLADNTIVSVVAVDHGLSLSPASQAKGSDTLGSLHGLQPLERRLPPDGGNSIAEFKPSPKLTEEECRRHVYTEEEQRKAEQLLDMIFGDAKLDDEDDDDDDDIANDSLDASRQHHRGLTVSSSLAVGHADHYNHNRPNHRRLRGGGGGGANENEAPATGTPSAERRASRKRSDSVSSSESIDTISSLNYPSSSNSSASHQLEATMASLSPLDSEFSERENLSPTAKSRTTGLSRAVPSLVRAPAGSYQPAPLSLSSSSATTLLSSPCGSTRVTIDRAILAKIRDQLSACLVKMRDLELQAKDVPVLQVKMSVLKEEKRLLKLQLKAKNNLRDRKLTSDDRERSPPRTVSAGTPGSSLSASSMSAGGQLSAGVSHLSDESLRDQPKLSSISGSLMRMGSSRELPPGVTRTSLGSGRVPPIPLIHDDGHEFPLLPKLEPLRVEEFSSPPQPPVPAPPPPPLPPLAFISSPASSSTPMSNVRPSKLEALQTSPPSSADGLSSTRVRRSATSSDRSTVGASTSPSSLRRPTGRSSSPGAEGASESDAITLSLEDQVWDETAAEPKYKSVERGVGGRGASDKALGSYLSEASINPEPIVIPKYYHHTGINCCADTRDRGTHTDGVRTRHVEVGSTSPLPSKSLCDQCQQDLVRPKRYPRTSGTQTTAEQVKDCTECVERRKRPLRSTAVNTDTSPATPEPPKKAPKESFTFDVCDGTSFTPTGSPTCAECDRRRLTRSCSNSVGVATLPVRTRDHATDPVLELNPPKRTPPTPPPKLATFTRGIGVQCTTASTSSQGVQVSPERVRNRDVGGQTDWRVLQRAQGTQTVRTENDRARRLDTNSVASGDYDVRHVVCDSCASKRLRSIGIGETAIYDLCCNRCAAANKRDGSVQCELLHETSDEPPKKVEMRDQQVLTDDSYCDDITELIAIPCERCDVERRDFGFGDEDVFAPDITQRQQEAVTPKEPVATEDVGVMTDHPIIEPLSFPPVSGSAACSGAGGVGAGTALSRTSSASSVSHLTGNVRLCDKCSCAIESVAKDFIDQNLDHLVAEVVQDPVVPTAQSRIPKLSHSRGPRAPPRRSKPAPFDSVSRSLRKDPTPVTSAGTATATSLDEQPIVGSQTSTIIPEPVERAAGEKRNLSCAMESACLILNEYLQRPEKSDPNKLKAAMTRIQSEWFSATSGPDTDASYVQDLLDELEGMSNHLLHRVINMADTNGNTALHYAVSNGNFAVVARLLDSRATDVNKQNRAGYTAVMLAALATFGPNDSYQRTTVHRLFNVGDVNAKASQNGQTALMLAASHGRSDMVKALLEAGADPNTQDNDGSTALMCAAEHGYIDVVRMLLANPDVEINIADHDGQTALSIAMEAGHKDTALLIYASSNFSRGSSPYSSLRGRKSRISPRATPPPSRPSRTPPPPGPSRPSRTPPPPSPSRSRKGSTSSVSSFSRACF